MHSGRSHSTCVVILTWSALLVAAGVARGESLSARIEPNVIYYGTQTLLVVDVRDASQPAWPTVSEVDGLDIRPYRSPSVMRDLFRGTETHSYRYVVEPERTGEFTIPKVTLEVGGRTLEHGPLTLRVIEVEVSFAAAELDPHDVLPGQESTLTLRFMGFRPGARLEVPPVEGLTITPVGGMQRRVTRQNQPVMEFSYRLQSAKLGIYKINGIKLGDVEADSVTFRVSPFVVAGQQLTAQSVVVGSETTLHLAIRGLAATAELGLVAPESLKVQPYRDPRARGPRGTSIFSFRLTPTEPGSPAITGLKLPDGSQVELGEPIALLVRQEGEGGILACRGTARKEETMIGEPFIVDYEVFFRGEIRGVAVDPGHAAFCDKPYIKVEPVVEPREEEGTASRVELRFGDQNLVAWLGSDDFNGRKEQVLRFALRLTPLVAGELSLDGLAVRISIQVTREQRTGTGYFRSSHNETFSRDAEVNPQMVLHPENLVPPPGYRGAVGSSFSFETALDRDVATALSPLELTMRITGDTVAPGFQPPALNKFDALTKHFEVSGSVGGGEVDGSTITFTQTVRPLHENVTELPALPLVYYDYRKKAYDTVYSRPISLEVRPGQLVGASSMSIAAPPDAGGREAGGVPEAGTVSITLGANRVTLGSITTRNPLGVVSVSAILAAGPASIVLLVIGQRWDRSRRPASRRKRQWAEVRAALSSAGRGENVQIDLSEVLQSALRLAFDLPPGELSPNTAADLLSDRPGSDRIRDEAVALLEICDAARFTGAQLDSGSRSELIQRARSLVSDLERLK